MPKKISESLIFHKLIHSIGYDFLVGVCFKDRDGIYQYCNKFAASAFGLLGQDDLVGKTDKYLAKKLNWTDELLNTILENNQVIATNFKNLHFEMSYLKENAQVTFLVNAFPCFDDRRNFFGIIYLLTDISKQKEIEVNQTKFLTEISNQVLGEKTCKVMPMEDKIKWVSSFFRVITRDIPGFAYWKNKDFVYLGCNERIAEAAGMHRSEMSGLTDYDLGKILGWDKKVIDKNIRHVDKDVMNGKTYSSEELLKKVDGNQLVLFTNKSPIKNNDGDIIGIMGLSLDITELKRLQEELRIAKEKAEEAVKMKTQFIENMEHDLRTPISGILGMLYNCIDNEKDPSIKKHLEIVRDSNEQLLHLLNYILEFNRIDYGTNPIVKKEFSLRKLVNDTINLEQPTAVSKNLRLKFDFDDRIPQALISDESRVNRILVNLISNALKFTSEGFVKVKIGLAKKVNKHRVMIRIIVKDTGIGIAKEKQKIIYEKFVRLHASHQEKYPGSGLGLTIVKHFVEDLEGEISLVSKINHGSTFTCSLPFEVATNKATLPVKSKALTTSLFPKASILLVEDNKVIREGTVAMLKDRFKCKVVDTAANGKSAIRLLRQNKYHLVFIDIGLPDIDGFVVVEKLNLLNKRNRPVVIMLSAHTKSEKLLKKANEVKADDFIMKPLTVDKIQAVLVQCFAGKKHNNSGKIKVWDEHVDAGNDKYIDFDKLISFGQKAESAKNLLHELLKGLPKYLDQLKLAWKNKDLQELQDLAHALSGIGATCAAGRLKTSAKILEQVLQSGDDGIKAKYQKLLQEGSKTIRELRKIIE